MAVLNENVRKCFPLRSIESVIKFFRTELENYEEPDLTVVSVVLGLIESMLTCSRSLPLPATQDDAADTRSECCFPKVELSKIEALYGKFQSQIKGSVDLSHFRGARYATREIVKKVSDVIWGSLTRSNYRERAHLQSLYSYLTGNKLDCFGVAFAVVAACQILGFRDVHLALSEDHVWVIFGKDGTETAEVTWHGKGNEDKRGHPVTPATCEKSWIYVNGYPVKCTRHMEVAALVCGINPSINGTTDSIELATLQQALLWVLYDLGHLKNYPMAVGTLADMEQLAPTAGRRPPLELFHEAIFIAQTFYKNQHVYPYTYLGGFHYRSGRYKEALEAWANASDVIRKYNYSREDEEIYMEFLDIANELIPHIIKVVSSSGCEPSGISSVPLLQDPQCFAYLLRFYDGLCAWEEESSTPVLHIGWARPLVGTISKFLPSVRAGVDIRVCCKGSDDETELSKSNNKKLDVVADGSNRLKQHNTTVNGSSKKSSSSLKSERHNPQNPQQEVSGKQRQQEKGGDGGQETEFLRSLVTQFDSNEAPHPNIAALAAACGDNILNPEYLLGSGEPFSSRSSSSSSSADCRDLLSSQANGTPFLGLTVDSMLKADSPTDLLQGETGIESACVPHKSSVTLSSRKMAGLRELLLAEKLNTSAIQLQLTAQSQVQVVKRGRHSSEFDFVPAGRTTKRSRRQ